MSFEERNNKNPPFIFKDNSQVYTLRELVDKLQNSEDDLFIYHVNGEKNDFANWIEFGLRLPELAKVVRGITNKESFIEAIKLFLKKEESPEEKEKEEKRKKILSLFKAPEGERTDINNSTNKIPLSQDSFVQRNESRFEGQNYSDYSQKVTQPNPSDQTNTNISLPDSKNRFNRGSIKISISDPSKYKNTSNHQRLEEEEAKKIGQMLDLVKKEIKKVIFGQDEVINYVLIALLCEGDVLLEGVPGLAKSLLVETFSKVISGTTFNRIQFMPDLLPSDIIGGLIYEPRTGKFITFKGPIFANFILADEINRAPPKTHAALMEAMQERKVNIHDETYILDRPFFVLATQNPLENKGTYTLPEAVVDRFLFKIILDYPDRESEKRVINENSIISKVVEKKVSPKISKEDLLEIQSKVKNVFMSERIKDYILDLVEATRGLNKNIEGIQFIKYGAGPRASIYLGIASKARALMQGRNFVLPEDVVAVTKPILRHRLILNFKGKAHNISTDKIIEEILMKVKPE